MKRLFLPLLFPIAFAAASEGEKIYMSKGCYGCHGVRGEGIGDYPKIAGRPAEYLMERLHDLQKGIGHTSKRDIMIPFAKALREKEIESVSEYLNRIDPHGDTGRGEDVPEEILGGFGS
jgi:cytochrome c553